MDGMMWFGKNEGRALLLLCMVGGGREGLALPQRKSACDYLGRLLLVGILCFLCHNV